MEQHYQGSNGCPSGYPPADCFGPDGQLNAAFYPDAYMQDSTSGYNNMGTQGYAGVSNGMGPGQADAISVDQPFELELYASLAEMGTNQGSSCVPVPQGLTAMPNEMVGGPETSTVGQDDLQAWDGGMGECRAIEAHPHPTFTGQCASNLPGPQVPAPTNYMAVGPQMNAEKMGQDSPQPTAAFFRAWEARLKAVKNRRKPKERRSRNSLRSRSSAGVGIMTGMPSGMGPGLQTGTNYMGQGFNTPGQTFTGMPNGTAGQAGFTGNGVKPQPSPTCGFQNYTPNNYNQAPPEQSSPGRKRTASTTFVVEDPSAPPEKRARFSSEEGEQKAREEQRLMKEAGGSCLWCYRNKKKCDSMNPCSNCESNESQCLRDHAQLILSSSTSNVTDFFRQLRDTAMQSSPEAHINVNFRQPGTGAIAFWSASLPRAEPYSPGYVNEQLVSTLLGLVRAPGLGWIENETARHPLVLPASAMVRLLAVIKSLLRGQVYVRPAEADAGRITAFYMLTTCIQSLLERSQAFSFKLWEAVRHKSKPDSNSRNPTRKPLNPEWVATGLYYRVIDGLRAMQRTPLLEKALGDISHLHDRPAKVLSVLRCLPLSTGKLNSKIEAHDSLREHIPVLEEQWPLDIALLPGVNTNGQQLPPTVMQRLAEPFSGASYDMQTFLDDNLGFLPAVTTAPSTTLSNSNTNQLNEPDLDWDSFLDFEASQSSEPSASQSSTPSTETFVDSQENVLIVEDGLFDDRSLDVWDNLDGFDGNSAAYSF